ncbi:hypothetical protein ILUMI_12045 [Ignelater luminosus]|uniref:Osiris 16 n=1 Tax=Ignelater luminosus TaxID=2038154 RepID=A0A8K0CZ80_IGNLU|nr:hypothetical protein ILUMI_12045 [Ignelater luminosus]
MLLPSSLLFLSVIQICCTAEPALLRRVRECLSKPLAMICLKEEALGVLNRTIMSEKPMKFFETVEIAKDSNYRPNLLDNELPEDPTERGKKLNSLLYHKVEEFFESRSIKFSLANTFEGRKKKDKTGSMLMMGGIGMAAMMSQLFMGKIAFLAGAALLVAKMALMLAAIGLLKKSGGGGGGGNTEHIVYTNSESGYGHSHGGWHRSLSNPEAHNVAYAGQVPAENYAY